MAAPENTYTAVSVSGYNASAPPDDGTRTSDNKVEWQKHLDKIGQPLKTAIEAVDTNVSSAISSLIMTTDPGQETVVTAMRGFVGPFPDARVEQKRTLNRATALIDPASENFVVGSAMFS